MRKTKKIQTYFEFKFAKKKIYFPALELLWTQPYNLPIQSHERKLSSDENTFGTHPNGTMARP